MRSKLAIYSTLVVLWMMGSFLHAQNGYVYTQELNSSYASRSIYVCSDNSVVVLGNSDNLEELHYMTIAITKLDPQGNLQWRRYIDPGIYQYISITGVDIDNEDRVTFIVTRFGYATTQLMTVDSAGEIDYLSNQIEIPIPSLALNKALRTSNGEIVAVGKKTHYNWDYLQYVSTACFFRFSATGDTLSSAYWPNDLGNPLISSAAYDLALMDNGNVLVTCSLSPVINSILEVNPAGNIVNRYNIPGQDQFDGFPISRESNSQSYIIAYSMGETLNDNIYVDRFENGGFEQLFSIPRSTMSYPLSLIPTVGCLYLCGYGSSWTYGTLLSLSYEGVIQWTRNQEGANLCNYISQGLGSLSTALLGLDSLGCVYWAWGDSGQQVIVKLLPNGQVPVEDETQAPSATQITAYPNPMKTHLNIRVKNENPSMSAGTIDIFNVKGQLLRSLKPIHGETSWDGKDKTGLSCPTGVYFVRIETGKTTAVRKIMLMK